MIPQKKQKLVPKFITVIGLKNLFYDLEIISLCYTKLITSLISLKILVADNNSLGLE